MEKEEIAEVYKALKDRVIHPAGDFDKAGRWYAEHSELISVRSPSRSWPYSQMMACRTLKYVNAVADKFECKSKTELEKYI